MAAGGEMPVRVAERDISHAGRWDQEIQRPWIDKLDRIDRGWRWHTLYLRSVVMERAVGRQLAYLQLVTRAPDGKSFPLGQMLLASGYPYPPNRSQGCAFVWYLAGTPSQALEHVGIPKPRGILAALVDSAVQFSYIRGYQGRVCLHASPAGSPEQRHALMERYKRTGLQPHNGGRFVGWFRHNDGRYFVADEDLAAQLTRSLDGFRGKGS